ncbi:unnamed protein product [Ostreobium quekettii]|uniref:Uncharacterized protein n=1 Tax=Ostreobium quekettii TaxID=121088 RepID=A0A8S1IWM5_9CHLO|nr:unnamed protein product [Ostreobium quekettii]
MERGMPGSWISSKLHPNRRSPSPHGPSHSGRGATTYSPSHPPFYGLRRSTETENEMVHYRREQGRYVPHQDGQSASLSHRHLARCPSKLLRQSSFSKGDPVRQTARLPPAAPAQAPNPAKGPLRVTRSDAWIRFLAYEGCFQVCLKASSNNISDAQYFMKDGCKILKDTLVVHDMLLPMPMASDATASFGLEDYSIITWDDPVRSGEGPQRQPVCGPQESPLSPYIRSTPCLKVRFQGYCHIATTKGWLQRLKRFRGKKYLDPEFTGVCVHHGGTGEYFHAYLDGSGNVEKISGPAQGELTYLPDHMGSYVVVDLFNNEMHIATGRTSISALVNQQMNLAPNAPSGHVPGRFTERPPHSPDIGDLDVESAAGCLEFMRSPSINSRTYGGVRKVQKPSRFRRRSQSPDILYNPTAGGTQVDVYSVKRKGLRLGNATLAIEEDIQEEMWQDMSPDRVQDTRAAPSQPDPPQKDAPGKGFLRISAQQTYEYIMGAALVVDGCGKRKLKLDGEWKWLLDEFSKHFSIRNAFVLLCHMKWVMRSDVQTCTAQCLDLIFNEYTALRQEQDEMGLRDHESVQMSNITRKILDLLARTFENYYSLSEIAEDGIQEGNGLPFEIPPSALEPAVMLLGRIHDSNSPEDQSWLKQRFQIAARKKYQRLQCSCDEDQNRGPPCHAESMTPSMPRSTTAGHHINVHGYRQSVNALPNSANTKLQIYKKIEALAMALRSDLDVDRKIHESAVLPHFLCLPSVTSVVFCQELEAKLKDMLATTPPEYPSEAAIDMLVGVGRLQEYLERHKLALPKGQKGHLDAFGLFSGFVTKWIDASQANLIGHFQSLQPKNAVIQGLTRRRYAAGFDSNGGMGDSATVAAETMRSIEEEMVKFERVVVYWHKFGPFLETAICAVVRAVLTTIITRAGISRPTEFTQSVNDDALDFRYPEQQRAMSPNIAHARRMTSRPRSPFGQVQRAHSTTTWRTMASGYRRAGELSHMRGGRAEIDKREAMLLNSLRRMLGDVPQFEQTLKDWCGFSEGRGEVSSLETDEVAARSNVPPTVGAQFAQVVKELRTEYSHATVSTCERMARVILSNPRYSMASILHQVRSGNHAGQGQHQDVEHQVNPLLQALEDTVEGLHQCLDSRVFVTLVRGLWENISEELYLYVENLQEGHDHKGAWRSRQNASILLDVLNHHFRSIMTRYLEHDITEKDLELPMHASQTQKLLAENSSAANMSYTVY